MKQALIYRINITFVTRIIVAFINVCTTLILVKYFGPKQYGLLAVATTISTIGIQLGNLGLHSSNTYFVAQKRDILPTLISNSILISVGLGFIIAVFIYLISNICPSLIPITGALLFLSLIIIPPNLMFLLLQNILLGIDEIGTYNKIDLVSRLLTMFLYLYLIFIKTIDISKFLIINFIVVILALYLILEKLRKFLIPFPAHSLTLLKTSLNYGFKVYLACLFAYLVVRLDLLLINHYWGTKEAGLYSFALALGDYISLISTTIALILFPTLSSTGDYDKKWRLTKTAMKWTGLLMAGAIGITLLIYENIIKNIAGQEYIESGKAFFFLLPGVFFLSIETVAAQFLASIGFPIQIVFIWFITFIFNSFLNLYFVPKMGICAAAVISSFSHCITFLLVFLLIKKILKLNTIKAGIEHAFTP